MLGAECDVRVWGDGELDTLLGVAEGIYTYGHAQVDANLIERAPNLKVISNYGVGVDHIDLDAARRRGIPVGNTPHVLDGATADLTFALLLAAVTQGNTRRPLRPRPRLHPLRSRLYAGHRGPRRDVGDHRHG
jgi:lactate dehydrogenase-like 2-hydroxyacid dehydrogenase